MVTSAAGFLPSYLDESPFPILCTPRCTWMKLFLSRAGYLVTAGCLGSQAGNFGTKLVIYFGSCCIHTCWEGGRWGRGVRRGVTDTHLNTEASLGSLRCTKCA